MMTEQGRVLTQLLSGQFICQITDEASWRFLKNNANRNAIEPHLALLNRALSTTAEGDVFFASYDSINDSERKHLGAQFQEISSNLRPLVDWLLLVQQAQGNDIPIGMGSPIRLTELQSTIEDTPAFTEQLEKLSRYRLFGSASTQTDGQLKQVFKRLHDLGYLAKPNPEKPIYIATGKIDYLYEVLRFIDETESLSLTEQAEAATSQGSLL
ncbi:condensin complex protein MksE [Alteromonas oceanisediminis]|uniref:condensin complex protein MksE n=1 Tax=Alteromonas oceanisediminis TaxID=2836180 RepID=UPI001BDA3F6F|nr:hypothetical protein [Alteromonas oceanisediminis]MBT0585126.1 hypothetical protein [Alteromonas oceanisediminis]